MGPFMSFLAGIAPTLLGGAISAKGQRDANRTNIMLSREERDFVERMSNTAHQREVRDLRIAGLNPILSATGGGGASTPSYTPATVENEASEAVSSALSIKRLRSEMDLLGAQYRATESQKNKNQADESLSNANRDIALETLALVQEFGKRERDAAINETNARTAAQNADTALKVAALPGARVRGSESVALAESLRNPQQLLEYLVDQAARSLRLRRR